MLIIRFSRQGKRKRPFYRLIISEKARDTQGVYLELLGTYDPLTKEARLKTERISHWLKQGAQTSNSVNNLLINQGLIKGKKRKSVSISRERHVKIDAKNKTAEAAAAPATAAEPAEVKTEAKIETAVEVTPATAARPPRFAGEAGVDQTDSK